MEVAAEEEIVSALRSSSSSTGFPIEKHIKTVEMVSEQSALRIGRTPDGSKLKKTIYIGKD